MTGPTKHKGRLAVVLLFGVTAALSGMATAAHADPPGNNGTVKIDREVFDTDPDNQPHVGCQFEVDFYGFDLGNLNAHVTFTVHPPTGQDVVLLEDDIFIGEDAAGGGTDLDAEREYDLSTALETYDPHPQQGYHIKLTVNAEGSQGADTKYKVFWVQACEGT